MKSGIIMCQGCDKEFSVYVHKSQDSNWYVKRQMSSCKEHTKDTKKTTIHKNKRY